MGGLDGSAFSQDSSFLLSLVVPAYNAGGELLECLSAILASAPAGAEVIVADNGSTDGSPQAARCAYPQVQILPCGQVLGAAHARNCGLSRARGDWIVCVDADVRLEAGCLDHLARSMPGADIVFPTLRTPAGHLLNPRTSFTRRNCLNSAVFGLRRSAMARMDAMFDETIETYGEDNDFFLRAQRLGLRIVYVPQAVALHPLRTQLGEHHYYLTVRNAVYVWQKLRGLVDYWMPFDLWLPIFLLSQLLSACANRPLGGVGASYTSGSRLRLARLFMQALTWNRKNAGLARRSRAMFRAFLSGSTSEAACES